MPNDLTTAESSVDGPTETHFKVRTPTTRTLRLSEVEPGMVLARDVRNDNGQLLYPEGTEIGEKIIRRLRNFGKRCLPVREYEERWVDEDAYQGLPSEAERLDTREIPLPESPREESSDEDESSVVLGTFDYLQDAESLEELEGLGENLLDSVDAESLQDDVRAVLDDVRDQDERFEETMDYLLSAMAGGENSTLRQQLLDHVEETEENPEALDAESPIVQDLMMEVERLFRSQKESKRELQDILHGSLEEIGAVNPESLPLEELSESGEESPSLKEVSEDENRLENHREFLREVLRDRESRRSILALIGELLEEQGVESVDATDLDGSTTTELDEKTTSLEDLEDEDLDALDRTLGVFDPERDGPEAPSDPEASEDEEVQESQPAETGEALTEFFEALREQQWNEAIRELESFFERDSTTTVDLELSEFLDRSARLSDRRDSLTEELREVPDLESEELFDQFLSFDSEADLEAVEDLPDSLRDELEAYRKESREFLTDFREDFAPELPSITEELEESVEGELLEKFQDMGDRITIEELREPLLESLYDTSVAEGSGPEDKQDEQLKNAVDEHDLHKIKQVTRLPDSVIEEFEQLYRKPEDPNKWQRKLLNQHESILEDLVYRLEVPEDTIEAFLRQFGEVYEAEEKPFSLFLQPPSPDKYHLVHSYNTSLLSLIICRELNLPENVQQALYLGSALADIGLTAIPDSFYLQEGSLSRRAENEVRKHPLYSKKIVSQVVGPDHTVAELVEQHHERLDGEGYPRRLEFEELSSLAAVLMVADVYTALIEERTYRSKRMPDEALEFLEERNQQFNAKITRTIRRTIGYYPNGSIVKLSSGRLAFVRSQNPDDARNPRVLFLTDENRNRLDSPVQRDLRESDLTVTLVLRT